MFQEIYTYGGGDILKGIFNAVSMLINNRTGDLFRPLVMIGLSIGAFWAVTKALLSADYSALVGKYFIPVLGVLGLLMVPSTSIHIYDVLTGKQYKVDHVPFLLAKVSEGVSTIGYRINHAFESRMHGNNDPLYNESGMIFGGETYLDVNQLQITDATLNQNMKNFCKQCVLYDLYLNFYSLDELKKSTNIWELLEQKTSKVRMTNYRDSTRPGETNLLTCRKAVGEMRKVLEKEKRYYAQHGLLKNLNLSYQAITGLQSSSEDLIGQALAMSALRGGFEGDDFAKARASGQQRSTYQILGSLALKSLISMRAVLEALIYAAFVLVVPMTLLPGGFSFLKNWIEILIWIQLWPPFFTIIQYIILSLSKAKAQTLFYGLSKTACGLSFFSSEGLLALQEDTIALAGYLCASIPFISFAVMKGGVSSFIHLAGAMMTPAHTAAGAAAQEKTTGNYALASASYGNLNYGGASSFQRNFAPSLASGFDTDHFGGVSVTDKGGSLILKENLSEGRFSAAAQHQIQESLSQSVQNSRNELESKSVSNNKTQTQLASEAWTELNSYTADYFLSQGQSGEEAAQSMEVVNDTISNTQTLSNNTGISEVDLLRMSIHASAGYSSPTKLIGLGLEAGVDASGSLEDSANSNWNLAKNTDEFKSIQDGITVLNSQASNKQSASSESTQESLSSEWSVRNERMKSSQESYDEAVAKHRTLEEAQSYIDQNSASFNQNNSDEFYNTFIEEAGDLSEAMSILENSSRTEERDLLVAKVMGKLDAKYGPSGKPDISELHQGSLGESDKAKGAFDEKSDWLQKKDDIEGRIKILSGEIQRKVSNHEEFINQSHQDTNLEMEIAKGGIKKEHERLRGDVEKPIKRHQEGLVGKLAEGVRSTKDSAVDKLDGVFDKLK